MPHVIHLTQLLSFACPLLLAPALVGSLSQEAVIYDHPVPLEGSFEDYQWALVNLVLVCIALLCIILFAARLLVIAYWQAKLADESEKSEAAQQQAVSRIFSDSLVWLVFAFLAVLASCFFFTFSQDIVAQSRCVIVDIWTPTQALFLAIQMVAMLAALLRISRAMHTESAQGSSLRSEQERPSLRDSRRLQLRGDQLRSGNGGQTYDDQQQDAQQQGDQQQGDQQQDAQRRGHPDDKDG